jgi:hypothetical protein
MLNMNALHLNFFFNLNIFLMHQKNLTELKCTEKVQLNNFIKNVTLMFNADHQFLTLETIDSI